MGTYNHGSDESWTHIIVLREVVSKCFFIDIIGIGVDCNIVMVVSGLLDVLFSNTISAHLDVGV